MAQRRRGKSAYKFTSSRRTALKRAQLLSARKRKGRGNKIAGAIAGTAVAGGIGAYIVSRKNKTGSWKSAVQPWQKEKVRQDNAISPPWARVPNPNKPSVAKPVKPGDAAAEKALLQALAQEGRDKLAAEEQKKKERREAEVDHDEFIDKTIPRAIIEGKPVSAREAKRAIAQHRNAIFGKKNENDLLPRDKPLLKPDEGANSARTQLDAMIAEGDARAPRKPRKAAAKKAAPKKPTRKTKG